MPSSLPKVIKIRSLLDTLNDTEFNQVLANFVKQCGRNALLTAFFDQFTKKNTKTNQTSNSQSLDQMLNITNIIIRKRQQNSHSNASIKSSISTIPEAIIGEVASYLPQTDHASLTVTNRSIYLGCNDPKTLKHADLLKFQYDNEPDEWRLEKKFALYDSIDLSQYPLLTHLEIDLSMFRDALSSSTQKTMLPHLYKLTLDGDMRTICNQFVNLSEFPSPTSIDLNKITHLKLYRFGRYHYRHNNNNNNPSFPSFERFGSNDLLSKDIFLKLLSHFPNVEHLNIDRVILEIDGPTEINLPSILPKLKAIRCISTNPHLQNHILTSYGASLKCATFADLTDVKIKSMPNLGELFIYSPTLNNIQTICDSAKSLSRIAINNISHQIPQKSQIQDLLTNVIVSHSSLEMLFVGDLYLDCIECICNGIANGVSANKGREGNLKIYISIGNDVSGGSTEIIPKSSNTFVLISRILRQLQETKLDNFILMVDWIGKADQEWDEHFRLFWNENKERFTIKMIKQSWYNEQILGVMVSNFNCEMLHEFNGRDRFVFYH